uniref:Uncharacterized protein n=1 Tax=Tanacetum cinerariifolium TaxID=118510 RepID=A0A699HK09_TANCI|nr:hypothetical protein [Tanacetum cinerariifolium]
MSATLSSCETFLMEMFPFEYCPEGNDDVSSVCFVRDRKKEIKQKTNENKENELDNIKTDGGYVKGCSENSGGKRLGISMVEEAWLSEKEEEITLDQATKAIGIPSSSSKGTTWYLFDLTPFDWCKTDAYSMDYVVPTTLSIAWKIPNKPSLNTHPRVPMKRKANRFLATAKAVIDCRMAKIVVGEGITRLIFSVKRINLDGICVKPPYYARKDLIDCHLHGEWEISRDAELNPFKDTLVFRILVEFLGAIPINFKCNMWVSKDLIGKPIDWSKPPKNRDGVWHAKIWLIDHDGEKFTKTLQSIPTTKKLSKRESPREIINLDHFYDTERVTLS